MRAREYLKLPVVALQFLTRIPVAPSMTVQKEHLGRCTALFPVVGAIMAGILFTIFAATREAGIPPGMAAAIVLASEALLTGAFHWDGLADTFDGFFSTHTSREEMLAIMHDSRVGVMGVVAIVTIALVQYAGLGTVFSWEYPDVLAALLAMHMLGKWGSVFLSTTAAYGRKEGKGLVFLEYASWKGLAVATLALIPLLYVNPAFLVPAAAMMAYLAVWGRYSTSKVGGVTGDVLGASIRLSETIVLTAIVAIH